MQQRYQDCRRLQYDALRRERLVLSFQFSEKSADSIFYTDWQKPGTHLRLSTDLWRHIPEEWVLVLIGAILSKLKQGILQVLHKTAYRQWQ